MNKEEETLPLFDQRKNRRAFLQTLGVSALGMAIADIPDIPDDQRKHEMVQFSRSQLGVNIHIGGITWAKLDLKKTIDTLFTPSIGSARIPIPFNEVHPDENTWNFTQRDWLLEKAAEQDLAVDLQIGLKTIGWPEVHYPKWLADKFPYLREKGVRLDKDPEVQKYIIEYLEKTTDRYVKKYPNIRSIQVENEPFSKRLQVSDNRFISAEFNSLELEAVRKIAPDMPFVQNIPIDTPEAISDAINLSDIAALNIYPQHNELRLPQSVFEPLFWTWIRFVTGKIRTAGKPLRITEMQVTPWNQEPFSLDRAKNHLRIVKDELQPEEGVTLWDPYLISDKAFIEELSQAA